MDRLKWELEMEKDKLMELVERMHKDIDQEDFIHLGRLTAEASECKAKISTIENCMRIMQ